MIPSSFSFVQQIHFHGKKIFCFRNWCFCGNGGNTGTGTSKTVEISFFLLFNKIPGFKCLISLLRLPASCIFWSTFFLNFLYRVPLWYLTFSPVPACTLQAALSCILPISNLITPAICGNAGTLIVWLEIFRPAGLEHARHKRNWDPPGFGGKD